MLSLKPLIALSAVATVTAGAPALTASAAPAAPAAVPRAGLAAPVAAAVPGRGSVSPRDVLRDPRATTPLVRLAPGFQGFLFGTDFLSPASGWAVGLSCPGGCSRGTEKTLTERWNGKTWTRVPSPAPSPIEGLFSVSATSPGDAWAVGTYVAGSSGDFRTLILHWDGTRWTQVPSPDPSPDHKTGINDLTSVSAVSHGDAWAAGYYCERRCQLDGEVDRTLMVHWNGRTWSQVPSPNPHPSAGFGMLTAVSARSAASAWAVGTFRGRSGQRTLILRWDGVSWSVVPSPNPGSGGDQLTAVTASSATNAWAAGSFCPSGCRGFSPPSRTLILHWNGNRWSRVRSPDPSPLFSTLTGITATSADNAWAVGAFCVRACTPLGNFRAVDRTLFLRWDGSRWTHVASPDTGTGGSHLAGVSAAGLARAWAVGYTCSAACAQHSAFRPLILRWNGAAWMVQRAGQ